jgi:two-component system NarL family sensor kinase
VLNSPPFDRHGPREEAEWRRLDEPDDPRSISASVSLDTEGRIRDASPAAAAMLGYEPAALTGRRLIDLAAQGWRDAAAVAAARVRYGATEDFSLMLQGRSGRLSLIEMAARPSGTVRRRPIVLILDWANGRTRAQPLQGPAEEELRRLAISLLRRREGERQGVARRLYDDLTPTLTMAKYLVEHAAQRCGCGEYDEACGLLGQAAASLRNVIEELRNISNELRPHLLDDLGLVPALEWYSRGFEEAHPAVSMVRVLTAEERYVPQFLKADIFRIAQDALGNVARHAQASVVRLSLTQAEGELRLAIEDNGRGFDSAFALQPGQSTVGLLSIRKRIWATGGRFALESRPQRGTRVAGSWTLGSGQLVTENGDAPHYPKSAGGNPIRL